MSESTKYLPVFTPDNEPYLGRDSVFHFDKVILSCLEANAEIAAYTHRNELNGLQQAACQIIPQGINLALSIRELVRQGYLFAAAVLMRPLIERAAIISYLHEKPEEVSLWQNGWKFRERPSLAKMLATIAVIIRWLYYGDHQVAPLRRSWNGTIALPINNYE